jgi:hypothetical protein
MIEYIAYNPTPGHVSWARVYVQRKNGTDKVYFGVTRASAQRLSWLCAELQSAGIGIVRPASTGWYWRRS